MPSLRERQGDIHLLAHHFLNHFAETSEKEVHGISTEAMVVLCGYNWPGNVRELMHVMERAVVLSEEGCEVTPDLFPESIGGRLGIEIQTKGHLKARVAEFERLMIRDVIAKCAGNITRAAEELGMTRDGLIKKMARLKMR